MQKINIILLTKNKEELTREKLRQIYRDIRALHRETRITVAASEELPIGEDMNFLFSPDPCSKGSLPAAGLAAAYLHEKKHVRDSEIIILCPIHSFSLPSLRCMIDKSQNVLSDQANIVILGMHPDHPSVSYDYILPRNTEEVSDVFSIRETKDREAARQYMEDGGLWRTGMTACRVGYLRRKVKEMTGYSSYIDLYRAYDFISGCGIGNGLIKKEEKVKVLTA